MKITRSEIGEVIKNALAAYTKDESEDKNYVGLSPEDYIESFLFVFLENKGMTTE